MTASRHPKQWFSIKEKKLGGLWEAIWRLSGRLLVCWKTMEYRSAWRENTQQNASVLSQHSDRLAQA
jgi:hypothetical protein